LIIFLEYFKQAMLRTFWWAEQPLGNCVQGGQCELNPARQCELNPATEIKAPFCQICRWNTFGTSYTSLFHFVNKSHNNSQVWGFKGR